MATAANSKITSIKPSEEFTPEGFKFKDITLRGTTYHLVEVEGSIYDDIIELSTSEPDEEQRRTTDWAMVNKMLVEKALREPHLTLKQINALPFGVRQGLFMVVNELHPPFPTEGRTEEADASATESTSEEK